MIIKAVVRVAAAVICLAVLALSVSCKPAAKSSPGGHRKIKVVTTLFPLYDMARHIGGDKAEVSLLLPPGVEPHSFEPNPSDVVRINEADIFIYTGKFMEPWAASVIKGAADKKLIVVDASLGTRIISIVFHDKDEPAGAPDPHIWLDFDNAKTMVRNIERAFEASDREDKDFFAKNAEEYDRRLTELDTAYRGTLSTCKKKEIVYAGHYAFGYLAGRYGLKYVAAQGVSPDSEPTAEDLIKLVNQIKKNHIRYVFYEELTSPKIAETLAAETGAKMLLLSAAHNLTRDQFEGGITFFDVLERDLENLRTGLECK